MAVSTRELQLAIKVSGKIGALTKFVKMLKSLEKQLDVQERRTKKLESAWKRLGKSLGAARKEFNKLANVMKRIGTTGMGGLGIVGGILKGLFGLVSKVAGIFKKIVSVALKILAGLVRGAIAITKAIVSVFMGMVSLVAKAVGGLVSVVSGVFGRIVGVARKAAIAMGIAIVGFTVYAIKKMADFELKMREVWTLMPKVSRAGFDEMYNQVLEMSSRIPKKAEDLAAGLYKVVSSGFKRGAEAMQIMNKGAELAVAGITDVNFALDPLISLLHAYGKGAESSAKAGDVLMKTLELSRMNFMELADGMGMVTGTAAAMNVTWEHLGASIALASRVLKPDVTFVAVNRAMMAMMAPAKGAAKAFKQYGFQVQFNEKGNLDMLKTIEKMREAMAGLPLMEVSKRMKAMFPNIRALRFWFSVLGQGADRVREVFGLMGEHAGSLAIAFKKILGSISAQFRLFLNNVKRVGIELLTAFGPDIADGLVWLNTKIVALAETIRKLRDAGYFAGLKQKFLDFVDAVQRTPAFEWLATQIKNLTTEAPSWFAEMASKAKESFESIWDILKRLDFGAIRDNFTNAFVDVTQEGITLFEGLANFIIKRFIGVAAEIVDTFSKVLYKMGAVAEGSGIFALEIKPLVDASMKLLKVRNELRETAAKGIGVAGGQLAETARQQVGAFRRAPAPMLRPQGELGPIGRAAGAVRGALTPQDRIQMPRLPGVAAAGAVAGKPEAEMKQTQLQNQARELMRRQKEGAEDLKEGAGGLGRGSSKLDTGAGKLDKAADKMAKTVDEQIKQLRGPATKSEERRSKAQAEFRKKVDEWKVRIREGKGAMPIAQQDQQAWAKAMGELRQAGKLEQKQKQKVAQAEEKRQAQVLSENKLTAKDIAELPKHSKARKEAFKRIEGLESKTLAKKTRREVRGLDVEATENKKAAEKQKGWTAKRQKDAQKAAKRGMQQVREEMPQEMTEAAAEAELEKVEQAPAGPIAPGALGLAAGALGIQPPQAEAQQEQMAQKTGEVQAKAQVKEEKKGAAPEAAGVLADAREEGAIIEEAKAGVAGLADVAKLGPQVKQNKQAVATLRDQINAANSADAQSQPSGV